MKAEQKMHDTLYEVLDIKDEEKDLYHLVRRRDLAGKDVQQVCVIKNKEQNEITSNCAEMEGEHEGLMNE